MAVLNINDLKPGMILADAVYNQQELLLLEKNTALTTKHIWILKTWGIERVSIKGAPKTNANTAFEVELESRETIERDLRAKFENVIGDPVMEEIMKAAGRQLLKSLNDRDVESKPK